MSHHPPAAAHHADSKNGWTLRQEIKITSKFRGKYLSIMPLGEHPRSVLWDFRDPLRLQVWFPAQSPSLRYHPLRLPLLWPPLHVEKGDDHRAQHHRGETLDRPGGHSWMGGVWKHGSLGNGAAWVGLTVLSSPQSGEIEIVNHKTGDKCILKFVPYSYFSRDVARKVRHTEPWDSPGCS